MFLILFFSLTVFAQRGQAATFIEGSGSSIVPERKKAQCFQALIRFCANFSIGFLLESAPFAVIDKNLFK